MRHPLVNPRLRSNMGGHWPSRCTIKSVDSTLSASRQKVLSGTYTVINGLSDIQCRLAPFIETRMTDDERRTSSVTSRVLRRTVKLNGYFPQIDTGRMVAIVDSSVYQIRGVESDSEGFSTRLRLEILTP